MELVKNACNFWSREGIFDISSVLSSIWPGEHNCLGQSAILVNLNMTLSRVINAVLKMENTALEISKIRSLVQKLWPFLTKMANWPRQLCSPGQIMLRTLEISKIPSQDQKLHAFLTSLYHQNLVPQQLTNLLQNRNGPNFWSRGGIFKKSSPVFLIWPGEDNVLSQIAYFQLFNDVIG